MSPEEGSSPRLVGVQHEYPSDPRRDVPESLAQAARCVEDGGIAVLPEYFYLPAKRPPSREAFEELAFVEDAVLEASQETEGALVATVPRVDDGEPYNAAIVAEDGVLRLEQRKIYPTRPEQEAGIQAGDEVRVAEVQGLRLGVLVCADVLALGLVETMRARSPDAVAVPVLSPNRGDDFTRSARTCVFVARAWDLGAYVVKAGGFRKPEAVGRSLLTAPWGVLAEAGGEFEHALLGAPFDRDKLERARAPFEGLGER